MQPHLYFGDALFAGAERSLRSAIAANPTWFKPHWMLAQVLRLDSRLAEAERGIATVCEQNNVGWTILRPTLIYAEGRDTNITPLSSCR